TNSPVSSTAYDVPVKSTGGQHSHEQERHEGSRVQGTPRTEPGAQRSAERAARLPLKRDGRLHAQTAGQASSHSTQHTEKLIEHAGEVDGTVEQAKGLGWRRTPWPPPR